MTATIAILTETPGWHGAQLREALAERGLEGRYVAVEQGVFDIAERGHKVHLPGFSEPPLAAFVRSIPGGSLEQVIFRLTLLRGLMAMGVAVYNDPLAIEKTVDKSMTSFLLRRAGLPTPDVWVCESREQAEEIYRRECVGNGKLVAKPLFGSQGTGLHLLDNSSGLIEEPRFAGVYYLQRYVDQGSRAPFDIRVFVINGKAVAAMRRQGSDWISNRARGGRCQAFTLDQELRRLSEAAVRAVAIDYAGVDLIADVRGALWIIEVNSIPAWRGLQGVTDFNIAAALIDDLLNRYVDYGLPDSRRRPHISMI